MSLSEKGEKVITSIFGTFITHISRLIGEYKPQLPAFIRPFVSNRLIVSMMRYVYENVQYIPDDIKVDIVVNVKRLLDDIDDEYVRSVLHGKPDRALAIVEEEMGELKWSGL